MKKEHSIFAVRLNEKTGQRQLHSLQNITAGEMLCRFGAREIHSTPSYLTLQVGMDRHILLDPEILQYCNHSCLPNVFFDTTAMELIALCDIFPEDELTFFYPSTEWSMAQAFSCLCGNHNCLGLIQGAAYLSPEALTSYRLTDFILYQLQQYQAFEEPARVSA